MKNLDKYIISLSPKKLGGTAYTNINANIDSIPKLLRAWAWAMDIDLKI